MSTEEVPSGGGKRPLLPLLLEAKEQYMIWEQDLSTVANRETEACVSTVTFEELIKDGRPYVFGAIDG